jgi:hypothetical protein
MPRPVPFAALAKNRNGRFQQPKLFELLFVPTIHPESIPDGREE